MTILVSVVFKKGAGNPLPRVKLIRLNGYDEIASAVQEFLRDCSEVYSFESHTVTVLPE